MPTKVLKGSVWSNKFSLLNILPWKIVFKLFKVVITDFFHVFKLNEVIQVNSHCHRCPVSAKDPSYWYSIAVRRILHIGQTDMRGSCAAAISGNSELPAKNSSRAPVSIFGQQRLPYGT